MVARAPAISSSGTLGLVGGVPLASFVLQRAPLGFGVDGRGKVGMPRHQHAEVDEIEHQ